MPMAINQYDLTELNQSFRELEQNYKDIDKQAAFTQALTHLYNQVGADLSQNTQSSLVEAELVKQQNQIFAGLLKQSSLVMSFHERGFGNFLNEQFTEADERNHSAISALHQYAYQQQQAGIFNNVIDAFKYCVKHYEYFEALIQFVSYLKERMSNPGRKVINEASAQSDRSGLILEESSGKRTKIPTEGAVADQHLGLGPQSIAGHVTTKPEGDDLAYKGDLSFYTEPEEDEGGGDHLDYRR